MGINTRMLKIDKEKFAAELRKRGLSNREASIGIGHSPSYIGNIVSRELIPQSTVMLLKNTYNIELDSYKKEEPPAPEPEPVASVGQLTLDLFGDQTGCENVIPAMAKAIANAIAGFIPSPTDLYSVIKSAVYEGVKEALNG